jgi:ATP-dependent DNA helicase RecG
MLRVMSVDLPEQLPELVDRLRSLGSDTQTVEVKSSVGKLPKTVAETLSAFANGLGGTLILGLDEAAGFTPARGFEADRIADAVASTCADRLQPPLRARIETIRFEDAGLVVASVDPLRPVDKPCYIKDRGMYQGSFIRTGDGDRRLSAYEVDRLIEEHRQPRWDEELIPEASIDDLDNLLLEALVARQRTLRPVLFKQGGAQDALQRLRVLKADSEGVIRPTLAGLLALGTFPQEFFPRLTVTFASFPGATKATALHGRERLLDSRTLSGPIPLLVRDTVGLVASNMRVGAVIEGAFRSDVPDYPLAAVREAVTNALMHRDYSDLARGTQVQVNMYVDRMEVLNPGGLYGTVTLDSLGKPGVSSARNQRLSALLEDVAYPDGGMVAENRGTGYATIESELQRALMPPPIPKDDVAGFSLTLPRRRLSADEQGANLQRSTREAILTAVDQQGSVSSREVMRASGLSRTAVVRQLNALVDEGILAPTEPGRSPRQRYRRRHDTLFDT